MKRDKEKFDSEKLSLNNAISNLSSELNDQKKQTESLTAAMRSEGGESEALRKNLEDVKEQVEKEKAALKGQSEELQNRINSLTDDHAKASASQQQAFLSELKGKEEEISVLKDTLLSRQMQVATAQAALATAESSLEEELRKHDAAISAAKHQRDEALSSANGEISGLQERVASLTSEVSSLSSKHGEI